MAPKESSFADREVHEAIDVGAVLLALADPCRREVLSFLDAAPTWRTDALVDSLGSVDVFEMDDVSAETKRIRLQHVHLPKLDDANLVEYVDGEDRIRRGADFELVRDMVDRAVEQP